MRGVFLRAWDDGKGVDSGRNFATRQNSGVPNITGQGPMETWSSHNFDGVSGAFYNQYFGTRITMGGGGAQEGNINMFDASRVSNIYQNNLTEVRVENIAIQYIIKY